MYGSWFPSVSTQMQYGLRSSVQVGVLIGVVVFQGETTGSSGLSAQSFLNLKQRTQLSNLAVLGLLVELVLAGVLRVELLQVVGRARSRPSPCRPLSAWPADGGGAGQHVGKQVVRLGERELDRVRSSTFSISPCLPLIAIAAAGVGHQILVLVDVLVPEHEVVGGERLAVRPLHAPAQVQR